MRKNETSEKKTEILKGEAGIRRKPYINNLEISVFNYSTIDQLSGFGECIACAGSTAVAAFF